MIRLKIDQIAIAPPDPAKAIAFLGRMGLGQWANDTVRAVGMVFGSFMANEANLAFNYEAGAPKELEVLSYTRGENWVQHGRACTVSHLGMHITEEELKEWREFMDKEGVAVAQEVETVAHTNEYQMKSHRGYRYVIFDTKAILGVDLKFIIREEGVMITVSCLECDSRHASRKGLFHGHEWCGKCNDTTNHIEQK